MLSNLPFTLYSERPKPPNDNPQFLFLKLPFRDKLEPLTPADESKDKVKPCKVFFFVTILMIPAEPSASYLAEGEVITSTVLIISAGICLNASAILDAIMVDGLLLIKTRTLVEPRSDGLPSKSTESIGTFFNTSVASPPLLEASFSALYTVRSTRSSIKARCPSTVTSESIFELCCNLITPKSRSSFFSVMLTNTVLLSYPIKETTIL